VAGIAASFAARDAGAEVTLYEAQPHLGGRIAGADSWDTGRHLVTSAYSNFLKLTDRLGTTELLNWRPFSIGVILGRRKPFWNLSHLSGKRIFDLLNFITTPYLPVSIKPASYLAIKRAIKDAPGEPSDTELIGDWTKQRFLPTPGTTVAHYFKDVGWSRTLVARFGNPVVRSICNLTSEQAAAAPWLTALKRMFQDTPRLAGWIRGEVKNLVSEPALRILRQEGVEVRLNSPVKRIGKIETLWQVSTMSTDDYYDVLIITTPPVNLGFLAGVAELQELHHTAKTIQARKIITVRAVFRDMEALPGPLGELDQDQSVWFVETEDRGTVVVERIYSALEESVRLKNQELKQKFIDDIRRIFGGIEIVSDIFICPYARATPSILPGTPCPLLQQAENVFYAGDWTATGLPPTLESAARAGSLAGKAAIR